MKSETGNLNSDDEVLANGNYLSLKGFLPSKSKMKYSLLHRRVYLYGEKFHELYIGNHDTDSESSTHDGSIPD